VPGAVRADSEWRGFVGSLGTRKSMIFIFLASPRLIGKDKAGREIRIGKEGNEHM